MNLRWTAYVVAFKPYSAARSFCDSWVICMYYSACMICQKLQQYGQYNVNSNRVKTWCVWRASRTVVRSISRSNWQQHQATTMRPRQRRGPTLPTHTVHALTCYLVTCASCQRQSDRNRSTLPTHYTHQHSVSTTMMSITRYSAPIADTVWILTLLICFVISWPCPFTVVY